MILTLLACSGGVPEGAPPLPAEQAGRAVAFARLPGAPAELSVADHTRPVPAVPVDLPLTGPFEVLRTIDGVTHWAAPLPVRSRALFFIRAAPDMVVVRDGKTLPYDRAVDSSKANSWRYNTDTVVLRTDDGEPEPGAFIMRYPRATERERALHWDTWSEDNESTDPLAFVRRSLQFGTDTRTGLLLPSPSKAAWSVELPPNATLQLDGIVLPPEAADGEHRSDGATVVVEIVLGDTVHEVLRADLAVGEWAPLSADLSEWAGRIATVRFRSEDEATDLDYVFLAEPTIFTPKKDPERVVLVFLDTLRADHLGTYGYDRPTSPRIDAWAEDAVVFENARSVAPWTLPSARSALSGRQPEFWPAEFGPILSEVLAAEGWATGASVGNVYLSSNFEMSRGWSEYSCVNLPDIEFQIADAEDFIERHPTRDVAVMLHTMDVHLPYIEPLAYRGRWAGDPPAGLSSDATRTPILKAAKKDPEGVRDWVIGRYDQNIAYTDDMLMDFLERVDADTVVIFADHGEEFWDHGDFEHGHTLYEELLHIPLIIKDDDLPAGRVVAPASILDITPTVLDLLDLPIDRGVSGSSLVKAAQGDADALEALVARPHSVGRPLYGKERWGVIARDLKWTTYRGKEAVYDLAKDPDEKQDLAASLPVEPLHAAFAEGLAQAAPRAWRIEPAKQSVTKMETLTIEHPAGLREAWLGQDPLKSSKMSLVLDEGVAHVTFHPGKSSAREIYVVPAEPDSATEDAAFTLSYKNASAEAAADATSTRVGKRTFKLGWAIAPVPTAGMQLAGVDPELEASLAAMGYQARDDEEE